MNKFKYSLALSLSLLIVGCSDNDTATTTNIVDATEVKKAAINIDNLTVKVHQNTFDTTSKMYSDLNRTLVSFEKMNQSVTDRMSEEMKLLTVLAKPFAFADNYSTLFSIDNNYTATTPAFVINQALTNKYFLVSSTSGFFLEGKTIRTYFDDSTTLANAWVRMISNADTTKDLYITIVELDDSNILREVSNSFIIKQADLAAL